MDRPPLHASAYATRYGPWAVVAGGSEGVGAAVATQLAEQGLSLVLVARGEAALEQTAAEVHALGAEVRTVALDLTAPDALTRLRQATDELEVGLLVLNAGANTHHGPLVGGDDAALARVLDLGITAPLQLLRHFVLPMQQRGRGGLLLVGSTAGFVGQESMAAYAAVKAFSRILAEGLWLELQPHGVDVLEVVLGLTRTPAMERAGLPMDLPGVVAADPVDVAREALEHLPHGPIHLVTGNDATAVALSRFPRDRVVTGNAKVMRRLLAGRP